MRAADIELQDQLEFIAACYEEYAVFLSQSSDEGDKYKGSIISLLNDKSEEIIGKYLQGRKEQACLFLTG